MEIEERDFIIKAYKDKEQEQKLHEQLLWKRSLEQGEKNR